MAHSFNSILAGFAVDPSEVCLLRHQTGPFEGRTPYTLWRDDPATFVAYQGVQTTQNGARLAARYWASFVVTPVQSTLFVGLYAIERLGPCGTDVIDPLRQIPATQGGARDLELYAQTLVDELETYSGRVIIDWGPGTRSWVQRASNQAKPILEISRAFQEQLFPGYTRFIANLSAVEALPSGWLSTLRAAHGVYLLTCPRTREQYVGSAIGQNGFLGRWLAYVRDGHGGNVGPQSRDPSDYQVSILEVSGSAATTEDILAAEQLWKAKLQSREMGLNRN